MVQKVRVNSSNERYNNLNDEHRIYDIEANVNISNGIVTSCDSGEVLKNGKHVTSFNYWDNNHLNLTYYDVELEEQCSINKLVNEFIAQVQQAVSITMTNV